MKRKTQTTIRKIHRYFGIFIGIQFLFWTISGLYFSWTDIDEIHGDHFKNMEYKAPEYQNLIGLEHLQDASGIRSIDLRTIDNKPYYWINNEQLYSAINGSPKEFINEEEALSIAKERMQPHLEVASIELIHTTDAHHEYRERRLPAYVISYNNDEMLKAFVSKKDGAFQTVRHRAWRWFDFLWMTHTMDYETRDNFNTLLLRSFSLLGLLTVLSGFTLWFATSARWRKFTSLFKSKS